MKCLLGLILLTASAWPAFGQSSCSGSTPPYNQVGRVWNVSTSGQSDFIAALNNEQISPQDGDVLSIAAFSCTWTGTTPIVNKTITNSLTIQGAGAQSVTSGGASIIGTDQTIIIDNTTGGADPIIITTSAGKTYRLTGIYFNQTIANTHNAGLVQWLGSSTAIIFDHNHLSLPASGVGIYIGGVINGVADFNYIQVPNNAISNDFAIHNGILPSNGWSNASWANPENFGSSQFFFIEDNLFSGGNILDASDGARYVVRHNNLSGLTTCSPGDCTQIFSHSTRDSERGDRAREIYLNTVTQIAGNNALMPFNSGTGLVWGNTVTHMSHIVNLDNNGREDSGTYPQGGPQPQVNYLGYCGPTPISYGVGTVTVVANSTAITGTGFNTSWPADSIMVIPGTHFPNLNGDGKFSWTTRIASPCASTTACTLGTASTVGVTNVAYYVGSPLDQNSTIYGAACLDQPGRGQGDLMTGNPGTGFTPILTDTVTGTQTWPNQPIIPIYVWNNTLNSPGVSPSIVGVTIPFGRSTSAFTDNVDFYQQFGTFGEPGSFNGTAGIGQGSSLPSVAQPTCTPSSNPLPTGAVWLGVSVSGNWGPGYWDTTNNTLYICTATNTWTAYYTPYTYPHPLVQSSGGTMTLNPTSQNFGSISLGTPSGSASFVLSNTTATTATAIVATVTGGNTADFAVSNNGSGSCQSAGNSISSGQSCTLSVIFTPQALGSRSSTLSVSFTNSSFAGPLTSSLSGNGIVNNTAPAPGQFIGN